MPSLPSRATREAVGRVTTGVGALAAAAVVIGTPVAVGVTLKNLVEQSTEQYQTVASNGTRFTLEVEGGGTHQKVRATLARPDGSIDPAAIVVLGSPDKSYGLDTVNAQDLDGEVMTLVDPRDASVCSATSLKITFKSTAFSGNEVVVSKVSTDRARQGVQSAPGVTPVSLDIC